MKDIQPTDIFNRVQNPINRVSVFLNGNWVFVNMPQQSDLQHDGQSYFKMNYKFGTVRQGETNPKKTQLRGKPGDYLVRTALGEFTVVPKQIYKTTFPTPLTTKNSIPLPASKKLQEKDFLDKVVNEYAKQESNSSQEAGPNRPEYNFKDPTGGQY